MPYLCELSSGQMLYLRQHGTQTSVTLASMQPGQQQQSSSSFSTGAWAAPPDVFSTPLNVIVRLHTAGGDRHLQIQGGSISSIHSSPSVRDNQRIQVNFIDYEPDFVMSSMNSDPMKMGEMEMGDMNMGEMRMGNMQMNMKPMEMRMGDMELHMDNPSSSQSKAASHAGPSTDTFPKTNPIASPESAQASRTSGQPSAPSQSAHPRRFCSQCGAPVTPTDRFCASCGTQLNVS
ncbi:MAG: zinc ribbon domain-containing protein [Elainellaceae cyanobacterium]